MAVNVFVLTLGAAAFAARGTASVTRVTDHDIRSEYHGVRLPLPTTTTATTIPFPDAGWEEILIDKTRVRE